MTEVTVCNTNRPGVLGCVKVGVIHGKNTELVNGEHQLQTEDPKTAKRNKLSDPSQHERPQRMSIQQTRSAATHVLSYEGLDTREEAQVASTEIRQLNKWTSPDIWFTS